MFWLALLLPEHIDPMAQLRGVLSLKSERETEMGAIKPFCVVGRITTVQAIAAINTDIVLNSVVREGPVAGQFAYNVATGIWTLAPGFAYELRASLMWEFTVAGAGVIGYAWHDSANNVLDGNAGRGSAWGVDNVLPSSSEQEARLIYVPAAATQVKLRVTSLAGGPANLSRTDIAGNGGFASVEQIS